MTNATLPLIAALLLKHFAFDFVFQTPYQFLNKGRYGHPAGLAHAGLHAAATLAVLLAFGVGAGLAAAVAGAEFVVHYHVDWAKQAVTKRVATGRDAAFWRLIGLDQLLHNLTYVAITAMVS